MAWLSARGNNMAESVYKIYLYNTKGCNKILWVAYTAQCYNMIDDVHRMQDNSDECHKIPPYRHTYTSAKS